MGEDRLLTALGLAGVALLLALAMFGGWWLRGHEPAFWNEPDGPPVPNTVPLAAASAPPQAADSKPEWSLPAPQAGERAPAEGRNHFAGGLPAALVTTSFDSCVRHLPDPTAPDGSDYCLCIVALLVSHVGLDPEVEDRHIPPMDQLEKCNGLGPKATGTYIPGTPTGHIDLERVRRTIEQVRSCEQRLAGDGRDTVARRAYCGCSVDVVTSRGPSWRLVPKEEKFCELVAANKEHLTSSQVLAAKTHLGLALRSITPRPVGSPYPKPLGSWTATPRRAPN